MLKKFNKTFPSLFIFAILFISLSIKVPAFGFSYIAHRADMSDCPEQTEAALVQAKINGYRNIEVDLYETLDHTFLICHDANLYNLCGEDVNTMDLTKDTYRNYPLLSSENYTGDPQYLITLEDVLRYSKAYGFRLFLHIKRIDTSKKSGCIKRMLKLIRKYGMVKNTIIYGNKKTYVSAIKKQTGKLKKYKGLRYGHLSLALDEAGYHAAYKYAKKKKYEFVIFNFGNPDYQDTGFMASPALIQKCHKSKIKVLAYPLSNVEDITNLYLNGYDGAFCNKKLH